MHWWPCHSSRVSVSKYMAQSFPPVTAMYSESLGTKAALPIQQSEIPRTDTSQISLTAWITSKCQSARYTILSPLLEALCHGSVDESKDHDRLILKRTQPSKRHAIQNRTELRLHRLAKIDPRKALPWLPYMKSLGFKADLRNSTACLQLCGREIWIISQHLGDTLHKDLSFVENRRHVIYIIYPYRNIIIYVMNCHDTQSLWKSQKLHQTMRSTSQKSFLQAISRALR